MKRQPISRAAKLHRWRISRLRATRAEFVGHLNAPDKATAIKEAIRSYGIIDPEKQKRLVVAQRVK